jgi:hypothetical protein
MVGPMKSIRQMLLPALVVLGLYTPRPSWAGAHCMQSGGFNCVSATTYKIDVETDSGVAEPSNRVDSIKLWVNGTVQNTVSTPTSAAGPATVCGVAGEVKTYLGIQQQSGGSFSEGSQAIFYTTCYFLFNDPISTSQVPVCPCTCN